LWKSHIRAARVSRTVRQENTIWFLSEHFFGGGRAAQDRHAASQVDQVPWIFHFMP
jgi:hypothetical protein